MYFVKLLISLLVLAIWYRSLLDLYEILYIYIYEINIYGYFYNLIDTTQLKVQHM